MRTYCSRVCMCVVCFLVLPSSAGLQPLQSASVSHSVISDSLGTMGCRPARLLCPRHTSGKNTGVGCHSLLQGIFPTQGLNLGLLHCKQILMSNAVHKYVGTHVCTEIHTHTHTHTHTNSKVNTMCLSAITRGVPLLFGAQTRGEITSI